MKNKENKMLSGLIILGLVMVSQNSYAGLGNKFDQYVGNDAGSVNGLYILLAVIAVGVIGKVCQNYFTTEEHKPVSRVRINHHRPRHIIKKTS
jgi:hypothetical protein